MHSDSGISRSNFLEFIGSFNTVKLIDVSKHGFSLANNDSAQFLLGWVYESLIEIAMPLCYRNR